MFESWKASKSVFPSAVPVMLSWDHAADSARTMNDFPMALMAVSPGECDQTVHGSVVCPVSARLVVMVHGPYR
jgi:hypothetical protein